MIQRTPLAILALGMIFVLISPLSGGNVAAARQDSAKVAYNLYFGDLHTHTGYSDGYADVTPWDAYKAAIDAGADFMAVTDHIAIWHDYEAWVASPEQWNDILAAADFYTSKKFVAMAGYEAWLLGNVGEINVYNTRELPHYPLGDKPDRLSNFYGWLADHPGAVGQFNHPLYVSDDFMGYSLDPESSADAVMGMIEVYNDVFYEDSYIMALDAGWHLMPTANSDTHYPDWISGTEIRTVLLAPSLTPQNLYAAMSAGMGYATLDKNLRISYTLNGEVMGSTLASPTSTYKAWVHIEDPDRVAADRITLVEIVSDGGAVVASAPTHANTVDLTFSLPSSAATYYYVRVTTASSLGGGPGVTAWTAPVWTGQV